MIGIITKAILFAAIAMVYVAVDVLQTFLVLPFRLLFDEVKELATKQVDKF